MSVDVQAALSREELEARRDYNTAAAETFLAVEHPDRSHVERAAAHATLAALYQARIEWEHGVGC